MLRALIETFIRAILLFTREVEARIERRLNTSRHESQLQAVQHSIEKANAARMLAEAQHTTSVYRDATQSPEKARQMLATQIEIERNLLELHGLQRVRMAIETGIIMPEAVARALDSRSTMTSPAQSQSKPKPILITQLTEEEIEVLATAWAHHMQSITDSSLRQASYEQWRNDISQAVDSAQLADIEKRAKEKMLLFS